MNRSKLAWSRRHFLASVGLGAAALPLLEAADSGACLSAPPKRVVFVVMPDGIDGGGSAQRASGSDSTLVLPPWMTLPAVPGGASLGTLKDQIVYIDGLNQSEGEKVASHEARPAVFNSSVLSLNDGLTNHHVVAGGPTIDYVIGERLAAQGVVTSRRVLNLQARGSNSYRASWRAAGDPVQPERDMFKVVSELFGGAAGTPPMPNASIARRATTRQLVVTHKLKELDTFKRRLGKPDQLLIDSWIQSLSELQRELQTPSSPTGGCGRPELGAAFDMTVNENYPKTLKAMMDVTVAAFASDVTRVAMLEWDDSWGDNTFLNWLGAEFAKTAKEDTENGNNHHHISHENGPRKLTVDGWYHSQFAYLMGQLASVQEGNGTLLDNTLVVCTSDGRNGASHDVHNTPWILGGGKNLGIRGGRYLPIKDEPKQHLLAALANAVGADIADFGGRAPMAGLG